MPLLLCAADYGAVFPLPVDMPKPSQSSVCFISLVLSIITNE